MKKLFVTLFLILLTLPVWSQISGVVLDDKGEPLTGASVYWAGTQRGVATDLDGTFQLMPDKRSNLLVVSFVGFHNDTVIVENRKPLTIVLVEEAVLDEVVIQERKLGVLRSRTSAFDTETLGTEELCKAACCNLSEAFETNASVDVAYTDAATGAKTIRLLGLSGTYVQLLQENTPGVRGLAQNFGIDYIPGPWMSSIQVSKGTASVINGYEAMTGQINVEFLKPQTQDPIAVNVMLNSELHAEANVMGGWQLLRDETGPEHRSLYTGVLAHYHQGFLAMDGNHDSFVDMPKTQNANLLNRWFYKQGNYTFQAFVRGLYDKRLGGQLMKAYDPSDPNALPPYLINLRTWRVEGFLKNGYVFDEESGSSVAIITAASYHNLDNHYGGTPWTRDWKASQVNAYMNAIYQGNFEGPGLIDNDHRLSAGLSLNYDRYTDSISGNIFAVMGSGGNPVRSYWDWSRSITQELTPGIFAEYSFKYADILSLVAGIRADWSNWYGFFFTPRMNVRYTPFAWWTIRASAGMGYRSPKILADNASLLPSSRMLFAAMMQGLKQEKVVNTGISTTFYIPIGSRELQLSAEYYYTHFLNTLIVDLDYSPSYTYIYNLTDLPGRRSFAHCAQVEATMEVLRGWTWTAAFRWNDVEQTTFNRAANDFILQRKPLTNLFKGIITTSYQTPLKKWQFDATVQFNGGGRMPDALYQYSDAFRSIVASSDQYYLGKDGCVYYKWYPQLMAQITKYFRTCSVYVGAENMTNFRQQNPIIGANRPHGADFDASMVWGPVAGWKVYAGFRWSLEKPEEE